MDHHSTASEMGMMGALRTGNMVVDMMIAMMVPYIFKLLMDLANGHGIENLRAVIFFWSPYHTRDIEHKILQTSWGGTVNQDRDLRNNVLIKAVQLYLDAHKIAYRNANLQLMSTKQESHPSPYPNNNPNPSPNSNPNLNPNPEHQAGVELDLGGQRRRGREHAGWQAQALQGGAQAAQAQA